MVDKEFDLSALEEYLTQLEFQNMQSKSMLITGSIGHKMFEEAIYNQLKTESRYIEHLNDPLCLDYNPEEYNKLKDPWRWESGIGDRYTTHKMPNGTTVNVQYNPLFDEVGQFPNGQNIAIQGYGTNLYNTSVTTASSNSYSALGLNILK